MYKTNAVNFSEIFISDKETLADFSLMLLHYSEGM